MPAPKPVIAHLQRSTYVVADLNKSLTFYTDILGFKVDFVTHYGKGTYAYDVFGLEPEIDLDFYALGTEDQPRSLGLLEVRNIDLGQAETPRRAALVININEFDQVIEQSVTLGLKVYDEYPLETSDGRKGREQGILDFDGNLVVVYCIDEN